MIAGGIIQKRQQAFLLSTRSDIQNNFVIAKENNQILITQISTFNELHNLQFNLLGNSLEAMFLPSAFILVEGKTDQPYIEKCVNVRFPDKKIVVVESQGDIKQRLHALKVSLGEINKSPFQSRIFAVLDSVHTKCEPAALQAMGMLKQNIVIWGKNGIEYIYPAEIMSEHFGCSEERINEISIQDDLVSMNGISTRKVHLSEFVLGKMTKAVVLPEELEEKLLRPLATAIG